MSSIRQSRCVNLGRPYRRNNSHRSRHCNDPRTRQNLSFQQRTRRKTSTRRLHRRSIICRSNTSSSYGVKGLRGCFLTGLLGGAVECPDAEGTPNTDAGVDNVGSTMPELAPGVTPLPDVSHATPATIETDMGPEPVPAPSEVRSDNRFFRTGTSTQPEVVRFAAVDKVGAPDRTCGTNACTYVDV